MFLEWNILKNQKRLYQKLFAMEKRIQVPISI